MSVEKLIADLGSGWLIVMGVCFVGVLYWAFGSRRRARHHDDH